MRPPLPPFTAESAQAKVQAAEDAWNSRDPERVALAYTEDSEWRNRADFFSGRKAIVEFLGACLKIESGAAARDFGRGQGGEAGASPKRAVRAEPTQATAKSPAAGGFSRKSRLASLLLSHRPLRVCSLVAPRQPAFPRKQNPFEFSDRLLNANGRRNRIIGCARNCGLLRTKSHRGALYPVREWHDDSGHWFRSYGNEQWEFTSEGLMQRRFASINDLPIAAADRKFLWERKK